MESQQVLSEEEIAIAQQKKRLLWQSDKPWEKVDVDEFRSYWKLTKNYFALLYKCIISHIEYFCYFCMLFATLTNGGVLYLVYPVAIFGYALLLEERPGKWFWYGMLLYSQMILILNFLIVLDLWPVIMTKPDQLSNWEDNIQKYNLGFNQLIFEGSWWEGFVQFIPEILTIGSIMVLILNQTLAGVFGVPFRDIEKFESGLFRYRLNIVNNEQEQ